MTLRRPVRFRGWRLAGYSAVDVEVQTEVEIRSHRLMAQHLAVYREHAPGFANAYLLLSAPQLGVRHARRLVGVGRVTREDWSNVMPRPDAIDVSPSLSSKFPLLSVPYGCLVPRDIDGLLVAGRHIQQHQLPDIRPNGGLGAQGRQRLPFDVGHVLL